MLKLTGITKNRVVINNMIKNYSIQQNFSTKKVVPSTLDKYDVVIIGSNMGAVLAKHIDEITKGRNTVFVASSSAIREQHHLRIAYELGSCKKENYILDTKTIITPFIPHSDGVRVKQIQPESNTVILENDRAISYNRLVISTGLNNDFDSIPGLKDAIYDQDHPAFSPYDVTGKQANSKNPYYWYNFHGGKCIFYIPEFPIRGEIQEYNFLVAYDQWEANQKNMSQKLNVEFIIVNANDSFSQFNKEADQFLKDELQKRGIKVLYNTKLESLNKNKREVTIHDSKGQQSIEKYDNFYSIIPAKGHDFLQEANLCNEKGLLSVDKHTLQHTKYSNIFGFGDIIDVPTTRSLIGTQEQLNVVRHNVIRSMQGQSLDAQYQGESKTPLYIGKNKLTFVTQNYFKNSRFNLLDKEGKHICYLRNFFYSHFYQYINTAYYKFAIWGKPYFFFPKTYKPIAKSSTKQATSTSTKDSTKISTSVAETTPKFEPTSHLNNTYFVIQDKKQSTSTVFKNELNSQQIQEKEAKEAAKKIEQEQKKKELQLKREQEEKLQKAQEEEYRKKREQEEQEKKQQQELQRKKEEEEKRVKEEQERNKKIQEEQEAQRLKQQQQLEQERQAAELKKQQEEAELKKQQEQEEAASKEAEEQQQATSSNATEEPTNIVQDEQEVAKKRKGRPKKGKKE